MKCPSPQRFFDKTAWGMPPTRHKATYVLCWCMITVQCRRYILFAFSTAKSYLILPCSMHVLRKSCAPPGLDHSTENSVPKLFWFLCHSTKNLVFGWEPASCCFMSKKACFLGFCSETSVIHEVKCSRGRGNLAMPLFSSWRLDWFRQSDGGGHLHFPLLELRILPKAKVSVPKLWYEAQMVAIVDYPWLQYKRCCAQCYIYILTYQGYVV